MRITISLFIVLLISMLLFGFSLGEKSQISIKLNAIDPSGDINYNHVSLDDEQDNNKSDKQLPGQFCDCLEALCRYTPCQYCPSSSCPQLDCCNEKCADSFGCFHSGAGNCFTGASCDYGPFH